MADIIIGGVILLAIARGFFKGFLGEFMTLIGWVICLVLVVAFAEPVSRLLPADAMGPTARYIASFAGLLLIGLIAWSALQKQVLVSIRDRGLSTLDSIFGGVLGGFFGSTLCILGLMLTRALVPTAPLWWQESLVVPKLMEFEYFVAYLIEALRGLFT